MKTSLKKALLFSLMTSSILVKPCSMHWSNFEHPTKTIRTVVLVDRKHRRYPVKADIVGLSLSTTLKDRVEVVFDSKASKAYLI